jgi:hypothetical protein
VNAEIKLKNKSQLQLEQFHNYSQKIIWEEYHTNQSKLICSLICLWLSNLKIKLKKRVVLRKLKLIYSVKIIMIMMWLLGKRLLKQKMEYYSSIEINRTGKYGFDIHLSSKFIIVVEYIFPLTIIYIYYIYRVFIYSFFNKLTNKLVTNFS